MFVELDFFDLSLHKINWKSIALDKHSRNRIVLASV